MSVLGLDVGTTGCKAMVFDERGRPVSHAYREYEKAVSASEIDPAGLWECVCEVIKSAVAESAEPVRALGISSFGESFVAIDKRGRALADVMLYTDPRGAAQCERYVEALGQDRIMQLSGLKPHPMYSLAKIGYLRDEQPDVFGAAHKFLLMEDFVIFRLTGECCIDYSLASTAPRLWVFDLENNKLLFREVVAHGQGTGENMARVFSNRDGSHQSSLGLFRTADTYQGRNGYSLRMVGLEPGVNDAAMARAIVMHGAPYVNVGNAQKQGRLGRSWGCPALRPEVAKQVIDSLKNGQMIFAYYPDSNWLTHSPFLACRNKRVAAVGAGAPSARPLAAQ